MRRLWVAALLAVSLGVGGVAAAACPCKAKGFLNAVSAGDTEKARSYLASELTLTGPGATRTLDAEQIDRLLDWDRVLGASWSYEGLHDDDGVIRGTAAQRSRFYELLGVDAREYTVAFHLDGDDRIRTIELTPAGESDAVRDAVRDALAPFLDWAGQARADELAGVYREGEIVFSGDSARTWLTLLQAWRAR